MAEKTSTTPSVTLPSSREAYCFNPATKQCAWESIPMPELAPKAVLIKVHASTIHPIDEFVLAGVPFGGFGTGTGPHIPGTESAGIVVAQGTETGPQSLIGKKVTIGPRGFGAWAEYAVASIDDIIVLPDDTTWEVAGTAFVNPLTALHLFYIARQLQSKAVISTGANSTVGRQISKLLQSNGIEVINVVRKAEKAKQMKEEGAKHVLNSSEADFEKKLKELAQSLQVNLVLEAVGGELRDLVIRVAPHGSTICIYGSLSGATTTTIADGMLLGEEKSLRAASSYNFWWKLKGEEKVKEVAILVQNLEKNLSSHVLKVLPFKSIDEARKILDENKKNGVPVDGKIVLKW